MTELPRSPRPLEKQVARLLEPFQKFMARQLVASGLLLLSAIAALVVANSGYGADLQALLETKVGLTVGADDYELSVRHWVNDGLMALFFFLLGLEIKRELLAGDLRDPRRSRLLVFAAIGGMCIPALVYSVQRGLVLSSRSRLSADPASFSVPAAPACQCGNGARARG